VGPGKTAERAVLQDIRDCVSCFPHQMPQPAGIHVTTVDAQPKPRNAGARRQRQRPIHDPNDVGNRDRRRLAREAMSAKRAATAVDQSIVTQLNQDRFEEFAWYHLAFGDRAGWRPPCHGVALGQHGGSAESIFRFAGYHSTDLPRSRCGVKPVPLCHGFAFFC
jgi:hypothetical protein